MYTWVISMYSGWWKLTILVFFRNKRIKEQCIWFENFTETACIVHGSNLGHLFPSNPSCACIIDLDVIGNSSC
ncbi:hypothetical protein Peur_066630 [Populus x canadensis]